MKGIKMVKIGKKMFQQMESVKYNNDRMDFDRFFTLVKQKNNKITKEQAMRYWNSEITGYVGWWDLY